MFSLENILWLILLVPTCSLLIVHLHMAFYIFKKLPKSKGSLYSRVVLSLLWSDYLKRFMRIYETYPIGNTGIEATRTALLRLKASNVDEDSLFGLLTILIAVHFKIAKGAPIKFNFDNLRRM